MKTWARAALAGSLVVSPAIAGDSIVGLGEKDLIACAGLPAGQMSVGSTTYWQYGRSRSFGIVNQLGTTGIINRREVGCDATVAIEGGRVVGVTMQPRGGILTGPLECQRLFAGCR